jgi:hypothetical protein
MDLLGVWSLCTAILPIAASAELRVLPAHASRRAGRVAIADRPVQQASRTFEQQVRYATAVIGSSS